MYIEEKRSPVVLEPTDNLFVRREWRIQLQFWRPEFAVIVNHFPPQSPLAVSSINKSKPGNRKAQMQDALLIQNQLNRHQRGQHAAWPKGIVSIKQHCRFFMGYSWCIADNIPNKGTAALGIWRPHLSEAWAHRVTHTLKLDGLYVF